MPITYGVGVDGNDDGVIEWGDYAGGDFSRAVIGLEWQLGQAQPYDSVAAPNRATITLRNESRRFSPEDSAYPLQPGKTVQIKSHDGLTERVHFTGLISHVEPLPGDQGTRTAVIHAQSVDAQLRQHHVRLPPQINQRADQVIRAVLDRVPLRRRVLHGRWILERAGHSELGPNTRLPDVTVDRMLQNGKSVFTYVGDTWREGIPVLVAIAQITEAERGRFFISREGTAVFYNRHHLLLDSTAQATLTDDMTGLDYAYGAEVVSRVQVNLTPRSIGPAGTTLWRLESAQPLPAASVRRLTVRFRDADRQPVGALNVAYIRPHIDYQANSQPNGSGVNLTAQVTITLVEVDFSAAVLVLMNTSRRDAFLLAGFEVRGTPVLQGDPLSVEQINLLSQVFYGSNTVLLDLPALDSLEQADQIARFELARRDTPRGLVQRVMLDAKHHPQAALARTLFERITLAESQTGHSADYFIVAEAHTVEQGGERHRVTWLLESASAHNFWLLGVHLLDESTILAY